MAQTFKETLALFGDNDDGETYSPSGNDFPKSSATKKDDGLAGRIRDNITTQKKLLDDVASSADARPDAPKPLTPPEPPKFEPSNPMDAFKSFAPMLAVWGSLATRHPLQTAIGALTAATAAQQKGDNDTYEKKRQQYTDNMDYTMKVHQQQQDEYKDILENKGKSDTDKLAIIKALAAQNKDELLLHYIDAGDIDGATDLITNKRKKAGEGLADHGNVLPSPEDQETYDRMAEQFIQTGQKPTGLGYGKEGAARRWQIEKSITRIAKKKGLDQQHINALGLKFKEQTAAVRKLGTQEAPIELAGNMLDRTAPLLLDAASKVDLSKYPTLNAITNEAARQNGDPNIKALDTLFTTFSNDYAALSKRGGLQTDAAKKSADDLANARLSPAQIVALVKTTRAEKDQIIKSIKDTREQITGEDDGAPAYNSLEDLQKAFKDKKITAKEAQDIAVQNKWAE